jgi:malate dehydrogenase
MSQMGAVLGFEPKLTGANEYGATGGSEVVVVTAGRPRAPGMSRDDLVQVNEQIVGS